MRNGQAYQQKTEKFSVYEEKKFGKIDSWMTIPINEICTDILTCARMHSPTVQFPASGPNRLPDWGVQETKRFVTAATKSVAVKIRNDIIEK